MFIISCTGILIFPHHVQVQPFLHASGTMIMDAGNSVVLLRGINLGGWLEMEGYMLQVNGNYAQRQIRHGMHTSGATEEEIEAFFSNWRKNHQRQLISATSKAWTSIA